MKDLRPDIERLKNVCDEASGGEWLWGGTICKTKDKAIKRVAQSIKRTKNPTDKFYEVFLDDGRVLGITGNGPTSENNAKFISTFSPENVSSMLCELQRLNSMVEDMVLATKLEALGKKELVETIQRISKRDF